MDARRPLGVLATVTVLGLWLRVQGLSHLGLWRDDAWVALSSRVGISTAWRMGVTARGFMLAERAWTLLHAGSPTWAQLLPLALGVAGILAVYALARQFGLPSWWSIGCATVVALSPIAIVWSTHVKQYSTDLLLSCVLLGLGERARRVPIGLRLALLGTASLVSLVVSASVVPILVGVWLALAVVAAEQRSRRRAIVVAGGVTAALCGAFALAALSHLPTALHRYWQDEGRFVPTSSVRDLGRGVTRAVEALATGVVHLPSPLAVVGAVLVALLV
ncbi:MAG TPA: hypothetical protein VMT43_00655, partial [Acidimicrobiales bacterium]|nr:hypothetical protein [Acidimicrobiales bacterium]